MSVMSPDPGGTVHVARYGRDLEDFHTGDVYEHRPGRTITQADNIQFSLLTMNRHPSHCDAAYAADTEFGQELVNSTLTMAVVTGLWHPEGSTGVQGRHWWGSVCQRRTLKLLAMTRAVKVHQRRFFDWRVPIGRANVVRLAIFRPLQSPMMS